MALTLFATHRARTGWSCAQIAERLGMNERHVRRWESGEAPAPERVLNYLTLIVDAIEAVEVPRKAP